MRVLLFPPLFLLVIIIQIFALLYHGARAGFTKNKDTFEIEYDSLNAYMRLSQSVIGWLFFNADILEDGVSIKHDDE